MQIKSFLRTHKMLLFFLIVAFIFSILLLFSKSSPKVKTVGIENESLTIEEVLNKYNYFFQFNGSSGSFLTPIKRDLMDYYGKKLVAFTFDDGPNTINTNLLLDGLEKYDAKVTFFIVGNRISKNKEVIKRAYLLGHDIGSHTYNHKNLFQLNNNSILNEINTTNEELKKIIGISPIYLRPPYGNINKKINDLTDMYIICWDVDPLDWKYKDRNKIKENILKNVHDGAIILLHDIYEESVMGALLAMEELEKEGYAFVTISEMAELKGVKLDYDSVYYHF